MKVLNRFLKNAQILDLIKIRPMEVELFHADRQTDMTKLRVAFPNFANAPKMTLKSQHRSNLRKYIHEQKHSEDE
jgi:hypothetical protein